MRYLAVDYGRKRLGLAICDPSETIVSPLQQLGITGKQPERVIKQIHEIISEHRAAGIVIGLPLNMDDSEGRQAKLSRSFAEKLAAEVAIPVYLEDERLSSAAADEKLAGMGLTSAKRQARRDMLAACEILHSFLENPSSQRQEKIVPSRRQ